MNYARGRQKGAMINTQCAAHCARRRHWILINKRQGFSVCVALRRVRSAQRVFDYYTPPAAAKWMHTHGGAAECSAGHPELHTMVFRLIRAALFN